MVDRGLAGSREKAKAMIMAGLVEVEGAPAGKPGRQVPGTAKLTLKDRLRYVSRGGLKLEAALEYFGVDVRGLTLLDIGASTGGFTDCLLQHGAGRVFAVDVGYGQLDWGLRNDPRVSAMERTNARFLKPGDLTQPVHGCVIDVSFISLELILPPVSDLLAPAAFIIALIKPQFEVGRGLVGKGGVVRDPNLHDQVIRRIQRFCIDLGWSVKGQIPSPILGPKGNREFLMYAAR